MPYIKKIVFALFPALILALLLSHPRLSADGAQKGLAGGSNGLFPSVISLYALLKAFS